VNRRRIELTVILSALVLDALLGWLYSVAEHLVLWHSLYCALANAITLGGDVSPVNGYGYAINTAECILVVPLFAAAISLFSSLITTKDLKIHINKKHDEMREHVTKEMSK
jgi:hypothetical protein